MNVPLVDIVTVNFNSSAELPRYFAALEELDYPRLRWRLVMVDNASTDGSLPRLREYGARVPLEVIALDRNGGVTAGNNAGIRAGESEYVALLNPDTWVTPGWLKTLVRRLDSDPGIGLVEARQVPHPLQKYYDRSTGSTSWASTGGVLIRRAALEQVGLFDERFFMYEDDVDLCWRLWLGGWRCVYEPAGEYEHRPHDERAPSPFLRYHVVRNQAFMRYLYGSPRLFVDRLWLAVKFAARDRRPDLRWAALRAVRDAVAALPWLRSQRARLPREACPWVGLFESPYRPHDRLSGAPSP
jgi:GT2 family glycosyltransferase